MCRICTATGLGGTVIVPSIPRLSQGVGTILSVVDVSNVGHVEEVTVEVTAFDVAILTMSTA